MRTPSIIAAALLALGTASSAFAAGPARDYQSPTNFMQSLRTREAVQAETLNAIASGELKLGGDVIESVRAALSETGHSQFVVAEVRAAVTSSGKQRSRLALWSRRLLGEAITQAQYVLAENDELADLVVSGTGGLGEITAFFDRLQHTHSDRMRELGLA